MDNNPDMAPEGLLYDGPRISHEDLKREFGLP